MSAQKLRGMECNSQWPMGCNALASQEQVELSWDGKSFVVDFRDPKNPNWLVWRVVSTDDHVRADGGLRPAGRKRWLTIRAKRVK